MPEISFTKLRQVNVLIEQIRSDLQSGINLQYHYKHCVMPEESNVDTAAFKNVPSHRDTNAVEQVLQLYEATIRTQHTRLMLLSFLSHITFVLAGLCVLGYNYIPREIIGYMIVFFLAVPMLAIIIKIHLNFSFEKIEAHFEKDLSDSLCK